MATAVQLRYENLFYPFRLNLHKLYGFIINGQAFVASLTANKRGNMVWSRESAAVLNLGMSTSAQLTVDCGNGFCRITRVFIRFRLKMFRINCNEFFVHQSRHGLVSIVLHFIVAKCSSMLSSLKFAERAGLLGSSFFDKHFFDAAKRRIDAWIDAENVL